MHHVCRLVVWSGVYCSVGVGPRQHHAQLQRDLADTSFMPSFRPQGKGGKLAGTAALCISEEEYERFETFFLDRAEIAELRDNLVPGKLGRGYGKSCLHHQAFVALPMVRTVGSQARRQRDTGIWRLWQIESIGVRLVRAA